MLAAIKGVIYKTVPVPFLVAVCHLGIMMLTVAFMMVLSQRSINIVENQRRIINNQEAIMQVMIEFVVMSPDSVNFSNAGCK
jgi:hypothetical protein